jgi:cytochrome c553
MLRFVFPFAALIACSALLMTTSTGAAQQRDDPEFLYELHCSGCHKRDGSGQGVFVPRLQGQVAQFLHKPGGREFLIRVPGVAQSMLSDKQVADVTNWALVRFDSENIPVNFKPITEKEVASLRQKPLSDASRVRAKVLAGVGAQH